MSGAPYPGSGVPYGDPTSGSPYGAPMGEPGYPPTSGAPYPNYSGGYPPPGPGPVYPPNQPQQLPSFLAPPSQPRSRGSFVLPLVALSVTLVVLVVAIVAVAVLRSAKKVVDPPASAAASSKVDACVVGTWNVTRESQDVAVEAVGSVTFVGSGARVVLRANGTGEIRYNGTTYTATINGHRWDLTANGSIRYDYTTSNGSMAYSNFVPTGTVVVKQDGVEATSESMTADEDPVRYTCSGDTMTQTTSQRNVSLTRVSKTT